MKRLLKYLVLFLLFVFLLCLVSYFLFPIALNSSYAKREIAKQLSDLLEKEVSLDGDITFSDLWRPQLIVEKVTIGPKEKNEDRDRFFFERFALIAPLLPNLRGEYEITDIQVDDLDVYLAEEKKSYLVKKLKVAEVFTPHKTKIYLEGDQGTGPIVAELEAVIEFKTSDSFSLILREMQLKIDESSFAGEIEYHDKPIRLIADIESNYVDLDRLLHLFGGTKDSQASTTDTDEDVEISYEFLKGIHLDVETKIEKLKALSEQEFEQVELEALLEKELLSIKKISLKGFGGEMLGKAKVYDGVVDLGLQGENLDLNKLLHTFDANSFIEARMHLDTKLRARGNSLAEMLNTLSGDIDLSSEKAQLESSTLKTLSSGLFEILSPVLGTTDHAKVECLLSTHLIEEGTIKSHDQVLKFGEVFVFGDGKVDLPKNKIEYNFHVNSVNPSIASLIPPFRMSGSLSDPSILPSASGSIASIADTAEGVAGSAIGVVQGVAGSLIGEELAKHHGLASCREALKEERSRLSSQVGTLLK